MFSSAEDVQGAAGIDRGGFCRAAAGDKQTALPIDGGAVRGPAAVNIQYAAGIDRGADSRGAGMHCRRTKAEHQPAEGVRGEGDL